MKIGIMGGTFDPIHNGHIVLAKSAYEQFNLDKVLVMPSANPPHKVNIVEAKAAQRSEMVKLAIEGIPYLEYSGIELERGGYIYSVDTLTMLKKQNPENEYYFIIGADSLFSLENWYRPDELLKTTNVIAAKRGDKDNHDLRRQIDYLRHKYCASIYLLDIPKIDISSRNIRQMISDKKDISNLVPSTVYNYIKKVKLYD